jgi:hypothetical protein
VLYHEHANELVVSKNNSVVRGCEIGSNSRDELTCSIRSRRSRSELMILLRRAKWDDVMRIAGDLFLDTQMFPVSFYVSKFPTDEELAAAVLDQRR